MIEIFTDGACSQNGTQNGGWAFIVRQNEIEIHSECGGKKDTTNNEMELLAFLNALNYAAKNFPNKTIEIKTDSAYVSNAFIQKWYQKWMINDYKNASKKTISHVNLWKEILSKYIENYHNGKLIITKVKGHDGVDGNIRADFLATTAKDGVQ